MKRSPALGKVTDMTRATLASKGLTLVFATALLAGCLGGGSGSSSGSAGLEKGRRTSTGSTVTGSTTNTAPNISGNPATTALQAQAYAFLPKASDKQGDPLSFNIQNKPAWATFSTVTGQLSGTPSAADVGSYANIIITVTDGKAATSLAAFTVTVQQVANGQATVSWTAPSQNTDGTALTNLKGYKIYYGRSADVLDQVITVDTTAMTTLVVGNLAPATYYFAMTSVNTDGVESSRSTLATKLVGG